MSIPDKNNRRLTKIEGWLSIISNALLFLLKLWAGIVTHSAALIADAWHTLSDSVSSIVVLLGVHISRRPPDKAHPYGHGRMEPIASLIIGILLGVVAFEFTLKGIDELRSQTHVSYGTLALWVTLFSIIIKEGLAQFAFRAAKKEDSPTLKADGWHHRTDALSSLIVLIGIFLGDYFWWIDGVLTILVALMIFYAAFEIITTNTSSLLGERAPKDLRIKLSRLGIELFDIDLTPHNIRVHNYGDHKELTCHIMLPPSMPIFEAHEIATSFEKAIRLKLGFIPTVHIEPLCGHNKKESSRASQKKKASH